MLARGVGPLAADSEPLLVHPAAAAAIPNAPKPRNARLLAPPAGLLLPSRVMADRMHPQRGPRKQDARSRSSGHGPFGINRRPSEGRWRARRHW